MLLCRPPVVQVVTPEEAAAKAAVEEAAIPATEVTAAEAGAVVVAARAAMVADMVGLAGREAQAEAVAAVVAGSPQIRINWGETGRINNRW